MTAYIDPDLYLRALEIAIRDNRASKNHIHRALGVPYAKTCAVIEAMERCGHITEEGSNGRRRVLATPEALEEAREHFEVQQQAEEPAENAIVTLPSYQAPPAYKQQMRRTEAIVTEILERVMDGQSLRDVCRDVHLPNRATFARRCAEDEDLQRRWDIAKTARIHQISADIISIADANEADVERQMLPNGDVVEFENPNSVGRDRLRVQARQWLLARLDPENFGERLTIEDGNSGAGNPEWRPPMEDLSKLSRAARLKLQAFLEQVQADEAAQSVSIDPAHVKRRPAPFLLSHTSRFRLLKQFVS